MGWTWAAAILMLGCDIQTLAQFAPCGPKCAKKTGHTPLTHAFMFPPINGEPALCLCVVSVCCCDMERHLVWHFDSSSSSSSSSSSGSLLTPPPLLTWRFCRSSSADSWTCLDYRTPPPLAVPRCWLAAPPAGRPHHLRRHPTRSRLPSPPTLLLAGTM